MEKLGTEYGGWHVPVNMNLNENSVVYSGGVGEDISFDLLISDKYNPNIFLIDPTEKSKKHYREAVNYFDQRSPFSGNIQNDYYFKIKDLHPNFDKIHYIDLGLWRERDALKFYRQTNPNYVSQSLVSGMFGDMYDIVEVDSLKNIMASNNHTHIDLLKLDIEGAELEVLEQMLRDHIFPNILCIEFDLKLKKQDLHQHTDGLIDRLVSQHNYKLLINDNFNATFARS